MHYYTDEFQHKAQNNVDPINIRKITEIFIFYDQLINMWLKEDGKNIALVENVVWPEMRHESSRNNLWPPLFSSRINQHID